MKNKSDGENKDARLFSISEDQCVWMKAGVVNFKLCENAYDCTTCAFDKAMTRQVDRKPTVLVSWREVKKGNPHFQRECRHMLTGRVQFKFCAHNYECKTCEYDQLLDDEDLSEQSFPASVNTVSRFAVADGYYYHKGHGWARIEYGGFVRLGIDDFALRLLGSLDDISLPRIGSRLKKNGAGWSVRKGDKNAEMLSPVSGVVMAANGNIPKRPELVKNDPYGRGWLLVVDPRGGLKRSVKDLYFEKTAVSWLKSEVEKLEGIVSSAYGVQLAATGGELVDDIIGNLPLLKWEDMVREFLHT